MILDPPTEPADSALYPTETDTLLARHFLNTRGICEHTCEHTWASAESATMCWSADTSGMRSTYSVWRIQGQGEGATTPP